MNNPFVWGENEECEVAFRGLLEELEGLKRSGDEEDIRFVEELESGKMLGVMVALDADGARRILYAFSGQLGSDGFYRRGFVEPVFDYLQPEGYFKLHEREIVAQSAEIMRFKAEELEAVKSEYERESARLERSIAEYKEECRRLKARRDARRGVLHSSRRDARIEASRDEQKNVRIGAEIISAEEAEELAAMIRESQYEKAELKRRKRRAEVELAPYLEKLHMAQQRLEKMKEERRVASEALQQWLFREFRVLNARGESKSLLDIFAATPMRIPPSGTGECCGPKLLQGAYKRGWTPIAMSEYWYGKPKGGELRIHGEAYTACRGKCLPVLTWMLEGLDVEPPLEAAIGVKRRFEPKILFENEWFCVVDKPGGMLSVAGKDGSQSLEEWLREKYRVEDGNGRFVKPVHRLDQDTSGLIIVAFSKESYKILQSLFSRREVRKTYIADLAGNFEETYLPLKGRISLPLSSDYINRPRQRVDFESGKEAVTEYEIIGVSGGTTSVIFHPLTGRTHQLRVHAASEYGLAMPIVGDRLYGKGNNMGERLHLCAQEIEFTFPIDGKRYFFSRHILVDSRQ